jgi:hypothetical protein
MADITPAQLDKINRFSRRALKPEELYVFTVTLCDNEIDRDHEQFPEESLEKLAELFVGKTGVFDHEPRAENQNARIFETQIVHEERQNALGEPYCCLRAWAYMLRCGKNADLILEIDAGIKKEVSVGCAVGRVACSACGADAKAGSCGHQKGEAYNGRPCCHLLLNPTDAYEWSFVAVPAQKAAGVTKACNNNGKGDATMEHDLERLKAMAALGEKYVEGLRRDVVKLASLSQPDIDSEILQAVVKKLDPDELQELRRGFGKAAARVYPLGPQLGAGARAKPAAPADNQFKI